MTHVRQLGPPVLVLIAACAPPLLEPPPRTSTIEEHASFYACRDGVDLCGAPVIGVPDQIICGADATSYQCQFDGWHWRPDLGACTQTCDGDTSYHCAPRARGNVCGEPMAGFPQQLVCDDSDTVVQCVRSPGDPPGEGHWESRSAYECRVSIGFECPSPPSSFYTCENGADLCGAPIRGTPNQLICGGDAVPVQCRPDGWHFRFDLGPCSQTCSGSSFTCGPTPELCFEPKPSGVAQEIGCTPFNDVMQCVQGPHDPVGEGHWSVVWRNDCDAITGHRCACVDPPIAEPDVGTLDLLHSQPVALVPGEQYEVQFTHSISPECTSPPPRFSLRIGGVYHTYHASATPRTETLYFIAREGASTVQFAQLDGSCGPATITGVHVACSLQPRTWPNAVSQANSDPWLSQHHDTISQMRPRVAVVNYANLIDVRPLVERTIAGLVQGSRFHGYNNASAPPFLDIQLAHLSQPRDTTMLTRSVWSIESNTSVAGQWLTGDFTGDKRSSVANVHTGDDGRVAIDVRVSNRVDTLGPASPWASGPGVYSDDQIWLAADFNGDGRTDLATVLNRGALIAIDVRLSTGAGFADPVPWLEGGGEFTDQQRWLVGDVDGANGADVIRVFKDGDLPLASIEVYRSTGTSFTPAEPWAERRGTYADDQPWLAGDVDGDGRTDMINVLNRDGFATAIVLGSDGSGFSRFGVWATDDGPFVPGQRWLVGDFNHDGAADLANVVGEIDPLTGATMAAIDVRLSLKSGFRRRSRWESRGGHFHDGQHWLVGDVNGGGYDDFINVCNHGAAARFEVHLTRANHSSLPRDPSNPTHWDYNGLFSQDFTDAIGIEDPATHTKLPLCDLIARGEVHEVWVYVDTGDNTTPNAYEVIESKQVYDADGVAVPGQFEPCAGNGCITGVAADLARACGRTVKVAFLDAARGPGCGLHSLGHGFEQMAVEHDHRAAVPALTADFSRFASFDRTGLPGLPWSYICFFSGPDLSRLGCDENSDQACLSYVFGNTNSLHWRLFGEHSVLLQEGNIAHYNQGCGSVHFPPNARDDEDIESCFPMLATCETFGDRNGPGGTDQPTEYTGLVSQIYDRTINDCAGGWQVYWRQSFPGRESRKVNQQGIPIPNWWPFLYY